MFFSIQLRLLCNVSSSAPQVSMVKGYFLPSHADDAQELQLHGIYYIVYCYTTRMYRMADRLWLLFWIPLTFTNGGVAAAATRHTPEARERETMMMMMHMAKISPRGALQAATAAAAATATGRRRAALAITVWIR